ncbi:redoxin family protein [Streptomyces sp. SID7803]|nr:redoxin family protein [Streptomyces sp. SID7803]
MARTPDAASPCSPPPLARRARTDADRVRLRQPDQRRRRHQLRLGQGRHRHRPPKGERADAPDLDGETVDGKQLDLADYKGKVIVLNAWGSWCAPCRLESKYFNKVAKETKDQASSSWASTPATTPGTTPSASRRTTRSSTPSFYDRTGKLLLRFPKGTFRLQSIPSTVVIDRDGKLAARVVGPLNDTQLRKMIDPLIAEK